MDATTIDLEQMGRAAKTAAMTLSQLTTLQKKYRLVSNGGCAGDACRYHLGGK